MATQAPHASRGDDRLTITGPFSRVTINTGAGAFSIHDQAADVEMIRAATFRLDAGAREWNRPKPTGGVDYKTVDGPFGVGTKAVVEFSSAGRYKPSRLLALTVLEEHPFIIIEAGARNDLAHPVRVREIDVVYGGRLFSGQTDTAHQSLRGGAGAEPNVVEDDWKIEADNSAMLTYLDNGQRKTIVAGGLRYEDFACCVEALDGFKKLGGDGEWRIDQRGERQLTLTLWDPHGRRVEPGQALWFGTSAYIDVATADPFDALERYGRALAVANDAKPNMYDFPTLCGWMVSTKNLGEGRAINNSPGLVEEARLAVESGVTEFTPVAVRLEPDTYCYANEGDTQQGWWDDEHWRESGSLRPPYETFAAFCRAVREHGALPFTYFQASMPSNDFAVAHPDWMINGDISLLHVDHYHHRPLVRYDYTHPGFREHTLNAWKRLGEAGLQGVKFDYPETGWVTGLFADPDATTVSAYRDIYRLCREGLGDEAHLHERIIGNKVHEGVPRTDVTAGIVDLQRVWGDASHFEPEMASRIGLRWYKNRVVFSYYPDGKSMLDPETREPLTPMQRRTFLTLIAMLSGRLELGTSFASMTPEMLRDLTRVFPSLPAGRSPRPVDAFLGKRHPEVYAYPVDDDWAHVVMVNNDLEEVRTITAPIAGDMCGTGSLGLSAERDYHVYDFWQKAYVGRIAGTDRLTLELAPGEARIVSIKAVGDTPQVIGTDRHILQGYFELSDVVWDAHSMTLSGTAALVKDDALTLKVADEGYDIETVESDVATIDWGADSERPGLLNVRISHANTINAPWRIRFRRRS